MKQYKSPPDMVIDPKKKYTATFHTDAGDFVVELFADRVPKTVNNFVFLAREGFYDGVTFHRVIPGFVIQGGCPNGTGTGDAGYKIKAEFNSKLHEAGVLSMARANDPHSGGTQFFLCLGRVPHLDRQYTAFGKTADDASLNNVMSIGAVETDANDKPRQPVKINKAQVIEKAK